MIRLRGQRLGHISNERTFTETTPETACEVLSGLCETIARARSRGVMAGHVALKLRYTDFVTLTRRRMITPTSVDYELHRIVLELYREVRTRDLGSACSGS